MNVDWTKEEFKTYLLIYCANADFSETKTEIDYIKHHNHNGHFGKMHVEFENDSDFERIEKIKNAYEQHKYENIDSLLTDVKGLFAADAKLDILEENLLRMLQHIFK